MTKSKEIQAGKRKKCCQCLEITFGFLYIQYIFHSIFFCESAEYTVRGTGRSNIYVAPYLQREFKLIWKLIFIVFLLILKISSQPNVVYLLDLSQFCEFCKKYNNLDLFDTFLLCITGEGSLSVSALRCLDPM